MRSCEDSFVAAWQEAAAVVGLDRLSERQEGFETVGLSSRDDMGPCLADKIVDRGAAGRDDDHLPVLWDPACTGFKCVAAMEKEGCRLIGCMVLLVGCSQRYQRNEGNERCSTVSYALRLMEETLPLRR